MGISGIPVGRTSGRRGRGGRKGLISEINVTPFVDVMLVLLIIFMVSAPLLVTGIPLELPKTVAGAIGATTQPLTVSIDASGALAVNSEKYDTPEQVIAKLNAQLKEGTKASQEPIIFKADKVVSYEQVTSLLAYLQKAGFTKITLASQVKVK